MIPLAGGTEKSDGRVVSKNMEASRLTAPIHKVVNYTASY